MEFAFFGKKFYINRVLFFSIIICLVIGSGILGYFLKQVYQPLSEEIIEDNSPEIIEAARNEQPADISLQAEEPKIKVYVLGCVNNPGVVTIKKGQIIDDAIKAVGGATKEADLENINLAYKLNDNTMLRIKPKPANNTSKSEKSQKTQSKSDSQAQKDKNSVLTENKVNSGVDIITDSLGSVVGNPEAKEAGGDNSNKMININTASQAELENLPSVGPATAKAIMEYREKNGGFKKITDIMKITGIKQKTYDKIKEFITIE